MSDLGGLGDWGGAGTLRRGHSNGSVAPASMSDAGPAGYGVAGVLERFRRDIAPGSGNRHGPMIRAVMALTNWERGGDIGALRALDAVHREFDDACVAAGTCPAGEHNTAFDDAHAGAHARLAETAGARDRFSDAVRASESEGAPDVWAGASPEVVEMGRAIEARFLHGDELRSITPPAYLLERLLVAPSVAVLFGASGVGKSFLALDWAMHIALGASWRGHPSRAGRVLYVAAEGVSGLAQRYVAWADQHPVGRSVSAAERAAAIERLTWGRDPVNIYDAASSEALGRLCWAGRYDLVIIDTLARSITGADENSNSDMGVVNEACDRIKRATRGCVLLIHHSGKDDGGGARGASALKGALDTELELTGTSAAMTLMVRKQKDGPDGWALPPMGLVLPDRGSGPFREPGGVPIIGAPTPSRATSEALALLDTLRDLGPPATRTAWLSASGFTRTPFEAGLTELVDMGLVADRGTVHSSAWEIV